MTLNINSDALLILQLFVIAALYAVDQPLNNNKNTEMSLHVRLRLKSYLEICFMKTIPVFFFFFLLMIGKQCGN